MLSYPFNRVVITLAFLALLSAPGCLTFSSLQSAKLVEPGLSATTIGIARNNFLEDDQTDAGWTVFDIRNRVGLGHRLDAALEVSATRRDEDGWVGFLVGGDLRSSLWRDHLALTLPARVLAGDFDFATFQFYPGLIATLPVTNHLEVNASGNVYLFVRAEELSMYTYSVGLGIRPTDAPWTLRPEVAWLRLHEEGKPYYQVGLAVEFPVSGRH